MAYTVIIEKTANGYSAYLPDLPGCVAAGGAGGTRRCGRHTRENRSADTAGCHRSPGHAALQRRARARTFDNLWNSDGVECRVLTVAVLSQGGPAVSRWLPVGSVGSAVDREIVTTYCGHRGSDSRPVITVPDTKRSVEVFRGCGGFSAQG